MTTTTNRPTRVLLRDVKAAERAWAWAVTAYGDSNMDTIRRLGAYYDLKAAYAAQKAPKADPDPSGQAMDPDWRGPNPC